MCNIYLGGNREKQNGKCYQHLPFLKTQVLIIATQLKTLNHCKSMKFISHTRHYMPNVNLKNI